MPREASSFPVDDPQAILNKEKKNLEENMRTNSGNDNKPQHKHRLGKSALPQKTNGMVFLSLVQ